VIILLLFGAKMEGGRKQGFYGGGKGGKGGSALKVRIPRKAKKEKGDFFSLGGEKAGSIKGGEILIFTLQQKKSNLSRQASAS